MRRRSDRFLERKGRLIARIDDLIEKVNQNGIAEMEHARAHRRPYDVQERARERVAIKRRLRALRRAVLEQK